MMLFKPSHLLLVLAATAVMRCSAVLVDHGPIMPGASSGEGGTAEVVGKWPWWYRDTDRVALTQCRSTAFTADGDLCFPLPANPDEVFYFNAATSMDVKDDPTKYPAGFSVLYEAALEAAYGSWDGLPAQGTEMVFTRIRIIMETATIGTYIFRHPYGTETIAVTATGPRALTMTRDIGVTNFEESLRGDVGPWLRWDTGVITVGSEKFVGNPSIEHAVVGSPVGQNYFEVEFPDGTKYRSSTFAVMGQLWTLPIDPPGFAVQQATYARTPTGTSVDVWAQAPANDNLQLVIPNVASIKMSPVAGSPGVFKANVVYGGTLGTSVYVYDTSSSPVSFIMTDLQPVVTGQATFASGTLTVTGTISDPSLITAGKLRIAEAVPTCSMTGTAFVCTLSLSTAPRLVDISLQGSNSRLLQLQVYSPVATATTYKPPIAPDFPLDLTVDQGQTVALFGSSSQSPHLLTTELTYGTISGTTYAPKPGAAGDDVIKCIVSKGDPPVYSAPFDMRITVKPPTGTVTAKSDTASTTKGTAVTINVLDNDEVSSGSLNPASVTLTTGPGTAGTAVVNSDGSITFTAAATFLGEARFSYWVKGSTGVQSNTADVTVTVTGSPEQVGLANVRYVRDKRLWRIDGTTDNPGARTITCYLTTSAGMDYGSKDVLVKDMAINTISLSFAIQDSTIAYAPTATLKNAVVCTTNTGGTSPTAVVQIK